MKHSRFTDEQIIGILKEQESGMRTADVCRKHGISEATFYKYKAKFGGMEVSDARKLKALEDIIYPKSAAWLHVQEICNKWLNNLLMHVAH